MLRLLGLIISCACACLSAAPSTDFMLRDLEFLHNVFATRYAPVLWKNEYLGWDLDDQVNQAKQAVESTLSPSTRQYQQIVKRLFGSTHDYHVRVSFHSTEKAHLPLTFRSANQRLFIVDIDRRVLSPSECPLAVGDEVIAINGEDPMLSVARLLEEESGDSLSATDRAYAELMLTHRYGTRGLPVPSGTFFLNLRSHETGEMYDYSIDWDYHPELITDLGQTKAIPPCNLFQANMDISPFEELAQLDSPHSLGWRKSPLPLLGNVLWTSSPNDTFHAYIYEMEGGARIGYVRIPRYSGGLYEIRAFAKLLHRFKEETEALVIDQLNNPGGNQYYYSTLLSMFALSPLEIPRRRFTITQEHIAQAVQAIPILEEVESNEQAQHAIGYLITGTHKPISHYAGWPISLDTALAFLNHCKFLVQEWKEGRHLTEPIHLWGMREITPSEEVVYEKPVLMLINELCFSAGDFVPAILQDNHRAVLMGNRTAGAGGHVETFSHPNLMGISGMRLTCSLAERTSGPPIENLGVQPDVYYEITPDDLQNQYRGYCQAINAEITKLIRG